MNSSTDLSKIPIKNLYFMLCYAWDHLEEKEFVNIAREEEKDMKHLLTRILLIKLRSLIKRGFFREYTGFQEEMATLRGKILFQESIKTLSFNRAKAHCQYDELSHDILHNQIIKSTMYLLLESPRLENKLKDEIVEVYHHLADISLMNLKLRHFTKIKLSRNNQHYRFVLDICRFLYESLLINEENTDEKFADFEREPKAMAKLFEEFVRNFYKKEMTEYRVFRENIYWDAEGEDLSYLPLMQTDISLENNNRRIIIDTKYYKQTLTQNRGAQKLISGNLYQLFAYLSNNKKAQEKETLGILLYPKTGQELNLSYVVKGYPVQIYTVDLNRDWRIIHDRLVEIVS